ncbi:hypothetical protein SALBM311S_12086 [Streptomyces alboniger]
MPDALGHALEAATLGYPAGHPDAGVVRDADNAAVMQKVMEKYSADPGLLKEHHEAMADSLGVMGAGYVDDINWALDKNDADSVFAPGKNPDGHLGFADTADGNGRSVVRGFLSTLGQHPDAYATVSTAGADLALAHELLVPDDAENNRVQIAPLPAVERCPATKLCGSAATLPARSAGGSGMSVTRLPGRGRRAEGRRLPIWRAHCGRGWSAARPQLEEQVLVG